MAFVSDFSAFPIVVEYYNKQKRSYIGRLQKIYAQLQIMSQPEMTRLLAVDQPFINIRRLKRDYLKVTHLIFPRLVIHGIYKFPKRNQIRFSLSFNFVTHPYHKPLHFHTDNPYLLLMYLAHQHNITQSEPVFQDRDKKRHIKNSDYLQPVIYRQTYLQSTLTGATYQGMYSNQQYHIGHISTGRGYVGKKLTKQDIIQIQYKGIQLLCDKYMEDVFYSLDTPHQERFLKYYNKLQTHKLVPFVKIVSRIPPPPEFKVVSGLIKLVTTYKKGVEF